MKFSTKLKVTPEKIESWENGTEYPTFNQAKALAKQYRVPFVYLYLPDTPHKTKRLDKVDYRTFGNAGLPLMSRELRWFLRDIEERRDTMIELYKESEIGIVEFKKRVSKTADEKDVASVIRARLKIDNNKQSHFRKPEVALTNCISELEDLGFLVFQATKIEPEEMKGLSIAYEEFPIIALNRKDEPSTRLFTLFHELIHILTQTSGICNDMANNGMLQNDVEMFCNRVAGIALVPETALKSNGIISKIKQFGFADSYIYALARNFAVSREVIINRLWHVGIISKQAYFDTLKRYSDEYKEYKKNKKGGFLPSDISIQQRVREILKNHRGLIEGDTKKNSADPFVIALAQDKQYKVVTEEARTRNANSPKIPDVCDAYSIECLNFVGFAREAKLNF